MTFSEREGFKPIRRVLQADSMDDGLRNRLWNILVALFPHTDGGYPVAHHRNVYFSVFCSRVWHEYFKLPTDSIPQWPGEAIGQIRHNFFSCQWYEVYDLMEFAMSLLPSSSAAWNGMEFNKVLAAELSGYRFVDCKLAPISSEQEIQTIERAIAQTTEGYPAPSEHLKQAVTLLAQKPAPDYRNSIKESISAVEGLCAVITGNAKSTLGQALKVIETEAPLHNALRSAFSNLYGYTSDADGIRHALMAETRLEQEDAVFMLVACSAFVSYLIAKQARKSNPALD